MNGCTSEANFSDVWAGGLLERLISIDNELRGSGSRNRMVTSHTEAEHLETGGVGRVHPRRHREWYCLGYIHPPPSCIVSCNHMCFKKFNFSMYVQPCSKFVCMYV